MIKIATLLIAIFGMAVGLEEEYKAVYGQSKEHDIEMSYRIVTEQEFAKCIHDGAIIIARTGREGDARYWNPLVSVLHRMGDIKPDESMICTRGHVIGALAAVTGCNKGNMINAKDWIVWLKENKNFEVQIIELR